MKYAQYKKILCVLYFLKAGMSCTASLGYEPVSQDLRLQPDQVLSSSETNYTTYLMLRLFPENNIQR
jgi:hypothetical protein